MKAPAVGEGRGVWAEWQAGSSRITRASEALWGKCPGFGFKGTCLVVSQKCRACWERILVALRLILMGDGFCLPSTPTPSQAPTRTRPALSASHSSEAQTAVPRPPPEPGASGNAFSSFLPCAPQACPPLPPAASSQPCPLASHQPARTCCSQWASAGVQVVLLLQRELRPREEKGEGEGSPGLRCCLAGLGVAPKLEGQAQ